MKLMIIIFRAIYLIGGSILIFLEARRLFYRLGEINFNTLLYFTAGLAFFSVLFLISGPSKVSDTSLVGYRINWDKWRTKNEISFLLILAPQSFLLLSFLWLGLKIIFKPYGLNPTISVFALELILFLSFLYCHAKWKIENPSRPAKAGI
jgi:hypothetical protein